MKKKPTSEERKEQLLRCIPDVFDYKTMLYIGAKVGKNYSGMRLVPEFKAAGFEIDILEAWEENAKELEKTNRDKKSLRRIFIGDVKALCAVIPDLEYDITLWWHGPEHILEAELRKTMPLFEEITKKLVILGSPYGKYDQGIIDGNPFEIHQTAVYPEFYESLGNGWKTDTLRARDERGSNLLAWKRI